MWWRSATNGVSRPWSGDDGARSLGTRTRRAGNGTSHRGCFRYENSLSGTGAWMAAHYSGMKGVAAVLQECVKG